MSCSEIIKVVDRMSREDRLKLAEYLRGKAEDLEGKALALTEQVGRLRETIGELEGPEGEKLRT